MSLLFLLILSMAISIESAFKILGAVAFVVDCGKLIEKLGIARGPSICLLCSDSPSIGLPGCNWSVALRMLCREWSVAIFLF